MIKAVIFDFGRVLYNFTHMRACENLSKYADIQADEIYRRVFDAGLEDEFENGRLTSEAFYEKVLEATGAKIDYQDFRREWSDMFWPNPEGIGVVKSLKGKYRMVMLTNSNEIHFDWISRYPEVHMMDSVVASHLVGAMKPAEKIYRAAIEAAGCEPEECVYIDDIKEMADAAAKLGVNAIHYTIGKTDLKKELEKFGVRF